MSELVTCPACSKQASLPDEFLGKRVTCPFCVHAFLVPMTRAEALSPSPPPLPARATDPAPGRDEPSEFAPLALFVKVKNPDEGLMGRMLMGRMKAKLTPEGLSWKSEGRDVLLPVGCGAAYRGENILSVQHEGRDLELIVYKPFHSEHRLARDIAAFLDGGRAEFRGADYRFPWYLIVLSVLPAFLGIFGIIPFLLSIGPIVLSNEVAKREQWPLANRVALCALIAVGTFVAYGILVALMVAMRLR
jgi:hypothetical protein